MWVGTQWGWLTQLVGANVAGALTSRCCSPRESSDGEDTSVVDGEDLTSVIDGEDWTSDIFVGLRQR